MRQNQVSIPPLSGVQLGTQTAFSVLSVFFERCAYYGIRSIFLIYAFSKIHISEKDAIFHYDLLIYGTMLSRPVGGFIADKLLGFKFSMATGNSLMVAACLLFCIPNPTTFFAGVILMLLANGFYTPTSIAQLLSVYNGNQQKTDGAFTIFYLAINAGALIGPIIISLLPEENSYRVAFILSGSFSLLSMLFSLLCTHKIPPGFAQEQSAWNLKKRAVVIISIILITSLFWTTLELQGAYVGFSIGFSGANAYKAQLIGPIIIICVALVTGIIWYFKFVETKTKWLIGFSIALFSTLLAFILNKFWIDFKFLLVPLGIMYVAEVFGVALLAPLIKRYANPRYFATIIGVSLAASSFIGKELTHFIQFQLPQISHSPTLHLSIAAICFIAVLLFFLIAKDPSKDGNDEVINEPNLKDNDLVDQ